MGSKISQKLHQLNNQEIIEIVNKRNRYYLSLIVKIGLAYAVLLLLIQIIIMGNHVAWYYYGNIVLFVIFNIIDHFIDHDSSHALKWLYLFITIAFIYAILMGSFWDSSHVASTFLVYIVFLPAFMIDEPSMHIAGALIWTFIFMLCSYFAKMPDHPQYFKMDLQGAIMFGLTSLMVNQFILIDRLKAIKQDLVVKTASERDPLTLVANRNGLKHYEKQYFYEDLIVSFFDIDDYKLLCDYYGHGLGDHMLVTFVESIETVFPKKDIYRYGDDEFIVIVKEKDPEVFEKRIQVVRDQLKALLLARKSKIMTSFCVGYVYGRANDSRTFKQMVRHAHVRLTEAKLNGRGEVAGSPLDISSSREEKIIRELRNQYNESTHDAMTGVYNLSAFRVEANLLPEHIKDHNSVLYFNIDGLKTYNESYGYHFGDQLIKSLADSIDQHFSKKLICRLGEDHFVALVENEEIEKGIKQVHEDLLHVNPECRVHISVGIYPFHAQDNIISACDRAKMACDLIRNNYDRYYQYYEDSLSDQSQFRNYILTHIERAAYNQDLQVYYQGVVDTNTKLPCGAEALIRWQDPQYGMIYPNKFIPILEKANLIHIVDLFVIKQVCKDYAQAQNEHKPFYPVSVNLSRQDFFIPHFYDDIIAMVKTYHVPLKMLNLEVTERMMSSHNKVIFDTLHKLQDYGFEIWMDDFGSEYSSLNMMSQFHFDVIKLDMNFMRNFKSGNHSRNIISSIVALTKTMGGKTLSEGVEEEGQYAFLKSIGCDMIQGYYFFKPQPKNVFLKEATQYESERTLAK